jgi:hypothetical protein
LLPLLGRGIVPLLFSAQFLSVCWFAPVGLPGLS